MRILILTLALSAAATPVLAQQAAPSAAALHLRVLSWPGKVTAPAPRRAQPVGPATGMAADAAQPLREVRIDPAWRPAYRPIPHGASHMLGDVTPQQAAAIDAQRAAAEAARIKVQAEAQAQAEARPQAPARPAPALPSSIYAAAPPTAGQPGGRVAMAAPYDQKAHYYSLHRAYGERPDPITLSPQFLSAPSADLAEPPPPPPPRILPGSAASAAQQTAARVQQRDSSDSSGN